MGENTQLGWVYLMRNASMPGIMKIGFTMDDPWERANQLSSSTSVPTTFTVVYAVQTAYPSELEDWMHRAVGDRRVRPNREYFSTAILIYYDETSDTTLAASEEQENQWFTLKLKNSARLLSSWKRAWEMRERWNLLRHRFDAEENKLFDKSLHDYLEKKEVKEHWMAVDSPRGPVAGGGR